MHDSRSRITPSSGKVCQDWAKEAREQQTLKLPESTQVLFVLVTFHNASPSRTRQRTPEVFDMTFEQRTAAMKEDLKAIVTAAAQACPNLKLAYLGSDTWRGYGGLEPQVFEEGFAVKALIEDQIKGDPELAFRGENRKAPWLAWGGYIWEPNPPHERFVADGVHPTDVGAAFAVERWYEALSGDSTARGWFTANTNK